MIPDGGDGGEDIGEVNQSFVPADAGTTRREVDFNSADAGQTGDVLLVQPDTGGAGNALDNQGRFALAFTQHANETLLELRLVKDFQAIENSRHRLAR